MVVGLGVSRGGNCGLLGLRLGTSIRHFRQLNMLYRNGGLKVGIEFVSGVGLVYWWQACTSVRDEVGVIHVWVGLKGFSVVYCFAMHATIPHF